MASRATPTSAFRLGATSMDRHRRLALTLDDCMRHRCAYESSRSELQRCSMKVYAQPSQRASLACARWLSYCLSIGWDRRLLDKLEALWWQYHDHTTGELL